MAQAQIADWKSCKKTPLCKPLASTERHTERISKIIINQSERKTKSFFSYHRLSFCYFTTLTHPMSLKHPAPERHQSNQKKNIFNFRRHKSENLVRFDFDAETIVDIWQRLARVHRNPRVRDDIFHGFVISFRFVLLLLDEGFQQKEREKKCSVYQLEAIIGNWDLCLSISSLFYVRKCHLLLSAVERLFDFYFWRADVC